MKSLEEISWRVSEPEYRADKALSYSTIARYQKEGFAGLKTLFDRVDTPSLLFGSLVDTLLTEPEKFDELFAVAEFKELQPELHATITELYHNFSDTHKGIYGIPDEIVSEVAQRNGFWQSSRYKAETRAKHVREGGAEYYTALSIAKDRTIVSKEMHADSVMCSTLLRTHEDTKAFFGDECPLERHYQLKFKGEYEGIPLRIMMDWVGVDHEKKIIYPGDLKTTSELEFNFPRSFLKWKYYIQSNLYTEVLKQNLAKDDYFKDFSIANWALIVINRKNLAPMVWIDTTNHSKNDYMVGDRVVGQNWRKTVVELHKYLNMPQLPEYPLWKKKVNSITEYLNRDE